MGTWCPRCWHPGPEVALERLQALAAKRGGRCLSAEYLGVKHKYLWECAKGHRWEALKGSIYMGTWCPECAAAKTSSIPEDLCRHVFEHVFGAPFPPAAPTWNHSGGCTLHLDGYNIDLAIAFEHNGPQHYKIDGHFVRTQETLDRIMHNDRQKKINCDSQGVQLIVLRDIKITDLRRAVKRVLDAIAAAGHDTSAADIEHLAASFIPRKSRNQEAT